VPPVKHVPLRELVRGRLEQVTANERGMRRDEREHVLELVAKAEGPARLIKRRAREEARRKRLIEEPSVAGAVERFIRSFHA